jgi:hypothetical protein
MKFDLSANDLILMELSIHERKDSLILIKRKKFVEAGLLSDRQLDLVFA